MPSCYSLIEGTKPCVVRNERRRIELRNERFGNVKNAI